MLPSRSAELGPHVVAEQLRAGAVLRSSVGRFFLTEIRGVADSQMPSLTVVAYDESGREVARLRLEPQPSRFRERFDPSGRRPLLEIPTRRTKKPIRLYVYEE